MLFDHSFTNMTTDPYQRNAFITRFLCDQYFILCIGWLPSPVQEVNFGKLKLVLNIPLSCKLNHTVIYQPWLTSCHQGFLTPVKGQNQSGREENLKLWGKLQSLKKAFCFSLRAREMSEAREPKKSISMGQVILIIIIITIVIITIITLIQSVTVPKIFNDTDTDTFFRYQIFPIPVPRLFSGTKFFRYRFRYFFPVPNFSDTGSETFSDTNFFRYRFRYHQKNEKFPVTVPIRYRYPL